MKKLILLLILLASFVVADPPELLNQQYHGTVTWDKNLTLYPTKVVAKIGSTQWTSNIEDKSCPKEFCSAKFGEKKILRVQGELGDKVDLFIDSLFYDTYDYEPGVKNLNIDISSGPCDPDWEWSEWTSCEDGRRTREGQDLNHCADNRTQKDNCGSSGGSSQDDVANVACVYQWECGGWSVCSSSKQTRSCVQVDDCEAQYTAGTVTSVINLPRPVESKFCTMPQAPPIEQNFDIPIKESPRESCFDGILNQNEDDVDCGGLCKECEKTSIALILGIIFGVLLVIALLVFIYFYIEKKHGEDNSVNMELEEAFDVGRERGMSDDAIKKALIDKGWDPAVVNNR